MKNRLTTKDEINALCKEIDNNIANHITILRQQKHITYNMLSKYMGVSTQQIQKYLKGTNRISIGRLIAFSHYLECDINYFIRDYVKEFRPAHQCYNPFKNTEKLKPDQVILINKLIENITVTN